MKAKTKGTRKLMLFLLPIVLYFALLVVISRVRGGVALGMTPVVALGVATILFSALYGIRRQGRESSGFARAKVGHQMFNCGNYADGNVSFSKEIIFRKISCTYLVIFAAVFLAINSINTPGPTGEWDDYSLPVASLMTDGNFEISENDIAAYKKIFPRWADYIGTKYLSGFFTADGEEITWYFPVYSLFCVPFVCLLQILDQPAEYAFLFANITAFMLALLTVYHCLKVNEGKRLMLILLLSVHPIIFYFSWISAEVFIYSLVVIGIVFWCNKCYKRSAISIAVAGMLNATVLSIGIIMIIEYLIVFAKTKDINIDIFKYVRKNFHKVLKYGACFLPALIPFAYNFLNTGHFHLSASAGFADWSELIPLRFCSHLFDLNYGIFPYFSGVFTLGVVLFLIAVVKRHWHYISLSLMFILTVFSYSVMRHINCGMSGIARYGAWSSVILIFAVCMYVDEIVIKKVRRNIAHITMMVSILLSGLLLHNYGLVLAKNTSYVYMTPLAKYVLERAPELYNPLHSTFNSRVNHVDGGYIYKTPVIYIAEDGYVRKILATKNDAKELLDNYAMEGANDWFYQRVESLTEKESYISVPLTYKLKKCKKYKLSETIFFDAEHFNAADYMVSGLSVPENWGGTWTNGKEARLIAYIDEDVRSDLTLELNSLGTFHGPQRMIVTCGEQILFDEVHTDISIPTKISIPLACVQDKELELVFHFPNAISPKSIGESEDERELAFALSSLKIYQVADETDLEW